MPLVARKVVTKRAAVLALAVAAPLTAMTIAAPSASAADAVGLQVAPATQTVDPGVRAVWNYTAWSNKTRITVLVTFGDGTSFSYRTAPGVTAVKGHTSHLFHPPCKARSHTYTQHWSVTDANGLKVSTTTKVTALYNGPLCG